MRAIKKLFAGATTVVALASMSACGSNSNALEDSTAMTYCERLAKNSADYGFEKSLWDTDFGSEDGNTVVYFRNAKLGNAFGGQQSINIKCVVGGTNSAPELVDFSSF
ncbi:MAG: hypothetical protein LKJ44_06015 [Bifidobacteriaceae bacterium]|jgi:hypothetical protein|nr:hypothetical protein [Bifidobacteriaceae bacterium]MCI1979251.1 hypothetical protein [Bifidobacteriaceae bacterium]